MLSINALAHENYSLHVKNFVEIICEWLKICEIHKIKDPRKFSALWYSVYDDNEIATSWLAEASLIPDRAAKLLSVFF